MNRTRYPALAAALWGGFVAGTLDIGAASLISGYNPVVILKYIAGGLLGKSALAGPPSVAVLGLVLQWAMSILIAAIFVFAARRLAGTRNWPVWGVAYGVVIFIVMNYVVVPLSALGKVPHFSTYSFIANLAAMLLFGWIVAFFARIFLHPAAAGGTSAVQS
ncbi:hypothetical protein ACXU4B_06820 [Dyella soli]|uniref:DUF1440 domain-containing protein n=1 Tax=Dyella soli TaxID=522319 RepID=A0A4R0YVR6_9GAMM|nr:hypothetical protein [Dyella soli]TCI10692.1 hypothetical protein EZM97_17720 [Dyella soli]